MLLTHFRAKILKVELRRQQRMNREYLDLLEEHAGALWTIFGVLFPDGFDNDAGFIGNLDKSKDSDGKFLFEDSSTDPSLNWIYRLILSPRIF